MPFFATYINDIYIYIYIYNAVGQNDVRLFADDTALFIHHSDFQDTLTSALLI